MKEPALFKKLYNLERIPRPTYDFDLEAFGDFLKQFDSPQNSMGNVIHIAGTNGKGSVAHILSSILREAGYTVGLYTSPHITEVNERIRINGVPISDYTFRKYEKIIYNAIIQKEKSYRTFFEAMTAQAFMIFRDNETDFAILETGLGGRLDSTNIVYSDIAVITKVGMDHMHILGETLEEIAYEKAGIIKRARPVFSLFNEKSVMKIIRETAKAKKARLHLPDKSLSREKDRFTYRGITYKMKQPGAYQMENAALCIDIASYLGIDPGHIKKGIEQFTIEGRLHRIKSKPDVYIDGSHNAQAIEHTMNEIHKLHPGKDIVVIASFMQDKDFTKSVNIIRGYSEELILTTIPFFRSARKDDYAHLKNITYKKSPAEAYAYALEKYKHNALIIFTGSFYLLQHAIKAVNT